MLLESYWKLTLIYFRHATVDVNFPSNIHAQMPLLARTHHLHNCCIPPSSPRQYVKAYSFRVITINARMRGHLLNVELSQPLAMIESHCFSE